MGKHLLFRLVWFWQYASTYCCPPKDEIVGIHVPILGKGGFNPGF